MCLLRRTLFGSVFLDNLVADEAAEATKGLLPKIGRARPQAERSYGTPDAGAVSMAMCIRAVL